MATFYGFTVVNNLLVVFNLLVYLFKLSDSIVFDLKYKLIDEMTDELNKIIKLTKFFSLLSKNVIVLTSS